MENKKKPINLDEEKFQPFVEGYPQDVEDFFYLLIENGFSFSITGSSSFDNPYAVTLHGFNNFTATSYQEDFIGVARFLFTAVINMYPHSSLAQELSREYSEFVQSTVVATTRKELH